MVGSGPAGIGRGEGDENVAGAVAGDAAVAAESERNAAREALELMRDERSVRGNNYDDRAVIVVDKRSASVGIIGVNFAADGNSGNPQIVFRAIVARHENSNGVTAVFRLEPSRRRADSSLEAIANHSSAAAHGAFFDCAGVRGVDGVKGVLRFD